MKISKRIISKVKRSPSIINPKIRICLCCGSQKISINKKNITCIDCGLKMRFEKGEFGTNFNIGDKVVIVEKEKRLQTIYKINKIRKTEDKIEFLLKSQSSKILLLFSESTNSRLEKI